MRNLLLILAAASAPVLAADADWNGRWNISYPGAANRASWMEVQGAETGRPTVKFVSIYAGDLNIANEASIRGGELSAVFRYKQRLRQDEEPVPVEAIVRARLEGGRLSGTTERTGSNQPAVRWVGV
ncbi:MAG: hypothetical protein K6T61_03260, partial [Bryobacteraceae bacterium]|nr:hypothetical protein [Bryobacteraceae bacterium]